MGHVNGSTLPAWAQRSLSPVVRENEFLLLASMVGHDDRIGDALELVGIDDFSQDAHRRLFRGLLTLNVQGAKIDAAALHQQVIRAGDIADVGHEIFGDLAAKANGTHEPREYAARVLDHAAEWKFRLLADGLKLKADSPTGSPAEMIAEARADLERLADRLSGSKPSRWPAPVPITELSGAGAVIDFLWHGCAARGHLTLLAALMKAGKTTLLLWLLRALQDGAEFLGRATQKCRTLLVTEESAALWCQRRDALGLDDSLHLLCRPMLAKPSQAGWVEFIGFVHEHAVERKCDLVFFDTVGTFAPWENENDAAQVTAALTPLNRLLNANLGVVLVHHAGKVDAGQGTVSRGSTALTGAVDVILELRRFKPDNRDDRRRVVTGYGRFDEVPSELVITLQAQGGYTAEGDRKAMAARELAAAILGVLPAGEPGLRGDEVHAALDEDNRPSRSKVGTALQAGADAGQWERGGTGVRGDPSRFWRP